MSLTDLEIYRLNSYPSTWSFQIPKRELAKLGLIYVCSNEHKFTCRCVFCHENLTFYTNDLSGAPYELHRDKTQNKCFGPMDPMNESLTDPLDYRFERDRYASFLQLPWHYPDFEERVQFGFHYIGPNDTVCCAFCELKIGGWQSFESSFNEHKRWNENCPFLKGKSVGNNRMKDFDLSVVSLFYWRRDLPEDLDCSLQPEFRLAIHKSYLDISSRSESFDMKTSYKFSTIQSKTWASAGFFYSQIEYSICCFSCNGRMDNYEENILHVSPAVEHAIFYPKCVYLNAVQGTYFVEMIQAFKHEILKFNPTVRNNCILLLKKIDVGCSRKKIEISNKTPTRMDVNPKHCTVHPVVSNATLQKNRDYGAIYIGRQLILSQGREAVETASLWRAEAHAVAKL